MTAPVLWRAMTYPIPAASQDDRLAFVGTSALGVASPLLKPSTRSTSSSPATVILGCGLYVRSCRERRHVG